ncbi:proline utilization trans-activator [Microdochium nivale]|nr:proline utilization trans-activator [Microdochium nivale]
MQSSPVHDDDGSSPGKSHASSHASKALRVLACLLCQQRKVRCDRKFPCANCTRSGAQCVPATLLPRQRRRRFPERELLDRLRHYEQLLSDHNVPFEPLHKTAASPGRETSTRASFDGTSHEHHDEQSTQAKSPNSSDRPKTDYKAKDVWDAMGHNGPDYNSDDSEAGFRGDSVRKLWDGAYAETEHMLFGTRVERVDLSPLHPGPAEIFRLWQTYMDNVNPLLNVTHTPTLQARIIEAAGQVASIQPVTEALMFSIYAMAVISLTPQECQLYLFSSKQDLLLRYHFGCQQALMNCGLLKTSSRDTLTAYYLYLVSLAGSTHPQTVYSLLAIAVRIAKRLGMHDEASLAKHTPFEAEMRRKLWWSLVLFDSRAAEKTDSKNSELNPSWDCRVLLNISDADLRPESKELQPVHNRSTEAVFGVIRSELGDYLRHADYHLDFVAASLRPLARPEPLDLDELQKHFEERYIQFFDQTNPLHFVAKWTTYSYIARYHLWRQFAHFADPQARRPTEADWDSAIANGTRMLEADKELMDSPLIRRYHWFLGFYFPLPAYLIIGKGLKAHPRSPLANRAWEVMSDDFAVRLRTAFRQEIAPFMRLFSPLFGAWSACVKAAGTTSNPGGDGLSQPQLVEPRILGHIRSIRNANATASGTADTTSSSPALHTDTESSMDDEMILTPDMLQGSMAVPMMSGWYGGWFGGAGTSDMGPGGSGSGGGDVLDLNWSPLLSSAMTAATATTAGQAPSAAGLGVNSIGDHQQQQVPLAAARS